MKSFKSIKWELGLVGALGIVILFNGIKASPSFDQAVLTASSQTQASENSQNSSDSSNYSPNPSGTIPNSQFNDSNSNSGNFFNQAPSSQSQGIVPHTRSRRS